MNIVIIGAGVAGLAIGWRLAQAGQTVTILERGQPGSGATGASAGMIAVTAERLESGSEEVDFARHSNALWPDFVREIEAVSGRPTFYRPSGTLILAEGVSDLARLERHGPIVSASRARDMVPLLGGDCAGALWAEGEAHIDSRALARALTAVFRKAGGRLETNEAAIAIERQDGRAVAVRTALRTYRADLFVLAAGAWSSLLEKDMAPVVPVKGQMIALAPPPGTALPVPMVWGRGIYLVPRGDYLLVGATVEKAGFNTKPTQEGHDALRLAAMRVMPPLRNWALADHWAGLRPGSPDGLPLLGPTALEGLWLASGQYRNGILFAPAVAQTLCDQILGRAKTIAAFDPRRLAA